MTTIREGGREIQLLSLGRAHTDGDVFVHLPREKVVVTGDAVVDWMPFISDGYPEEWVQTLDALEKFDFTQIIPGHGEVAQKSQVTFLKNYLADLVAGVKKAAADGATLDEMKTKVADQSAPKYEPGCRSTGPAAIASGSPSTSSTSTRRSSSRPDHCAPRAGVRAGPRRGRTKTLSP